MRNTAGLKRTAGPGRPKGLPNKATRDFKEWAEMFFTSPDYRKKLKARLASGKAQQLEVYMYQLLYGKPKEQVEVSDLRQVPESVAFILKRADGDTSKT